MKKVLKSLPSIKQTAITVVISLVLGYFVAGFHPMALLFLALGFIYLIMVTMRNYDPMAWEAYSAPLTHSMRLQRDISETLLKSAVDAYFRGDESSLDIALHEAQRHFATRTPKQ